eukprot:1012410-Rhodomonas_salina.1
MELQSCRQCGLSHSQCHLSWCRDRSETGCRLSCSSERCMATARRGLAVTHGRSTEEGAPRTFVQTVFRRAAMVLVVVVGSVDAPGPPVQPSPAGPFQPSPDAGAGFPGRGGSRMGPYWRCSIFQTLCKRTAKTVGMQMS